MILDGLHDRQALRQIALMLDKRPIALNDADAKEICATLRRIADEPAIPRDPTLDTKCV